MAEMIAVKVDQQIVILQGLQQLPQIRAVQLRQIQIGLAVESQRDQRAESQTAAFIHIMAFGHLPAGIGCLNFAPDRLQMPGAIGF